MRIDMDICLLWKGDADPEARLKKLNDALKSPFHKLSLASASDACKVVGGTKMMQSHVALGAWDYVDPTELLHAVCVAFKGADKELLRSAKLLVSDEHETGWRTVMEDCG